MNNYLFNGKEKQDELDLGWLDFGARYYDPAICKFLSVDPLTEKYPGMSPYAGFANNPVRYTDPTGMEIEEGSRDEWNRQRQAVEGRRDQRQGKIDRLNAKAEAKGWSQEKLASKVGNLNERVASLNTSIATMGTLEASTQVYGLNKIGAGETGGLTLNTGTNVISINFGNTANFVHEATHAGQFETGDIAFSSTGAVLGQDIHDEVAGYRAQFAYDPSSVSGLPSTSVANSFGAITPQWVQGVREPNGNLPYAPGGSANTGLVPVNINSTRDVLMQAYPNAAGALRGLPANYTLRQTPGIYYKR